MVDRQNTIGIRGITIPLPCFFPSVSSVKTNLMPIDYIELLEAAGYPIYLVSAYDIYNSKSDIQCRILNSLNRSRAKGSIILLDSGNYEAFWKGATDWEVHKFHYILCNYNYDLCFCYDNQEPPITVEAITDDVIKSVKREQEVSIGSVIPIIHGPAKLLPIIVKKVAEQLCPVLLAVPERVLGDGILERIQTVKRIRKALNSLGFYYPLHLLGTGNPLSIVAYTMAGADSFDGLEWCQTVVDHKNAILMHFHQWDFVRDQTEWGRNNKLPYIQSVLMHNLEFFAIFMRNLQNALIQNDLGKILELYYPRRYTEVLYNAIGGDK